MSIAAMPPFLVLSSSFFVRHVTPLLGSAVLLALVLQAGRRVAAALAYRDFRLLWFGALLSSIGTWMQKVAQAWLIVTLTGTASAFFLGRSEERRVGKGRTVERTPYC